MILCKKCTVPIVDGACPLCGNKKSFREAREGDQVYLTTCEYLWSRALEDSLREADIPFFRHNFLGSGLTASIGDLAENFRYYVNYFDYERAMAVIPPPMEDMTDEELNAYIDSLEDDSNKTIN